MVLRAWSVQLLGARLTEWRVELEDDYVPLCRAASRPNVDSIRVKAEAVPWPAEQWRDVVGGLDGLIGEARVVHIAVIVIERPVRTQCNSERV